MKRRITYAIFLFLGVTVAGTLFYFFSFFQLFEDNSRLLEKIEFQKYSIKVYHVPSDATIQSSIVIIKSEGRKDSLLAKFERFDSMKEFRLVGSDSIEFTLLRIQDNGMSEHLEKLALPPSENY
ncbi:hypothetical protein [Mariniradius sediminis]|uniref:Uncharacterized protein n=1 Tax=Mariniradius sediminis TaxID=2909237 RepID=A0ABS9BQU3_9BACT|nr:hypothetical protein [Mariniradius sediminis]MCF1749862.1 hypothetical protein [Mariniradius sediminis]